MFTALTIEPSTLNNRALTISNVHAVLAHTHARTHTHTHTATVAQMDSSCGSACARGFFTPHHTCASPKKKKLRRPT